MDAALLKQIRRELAKEAKKEEELQKRIDLQKAQREVMILEAQRTKILKFQKDRKSELKEVDDIKDALEVEKQKKLDKKKQ